MCNFMVNVLAVDIDSEQDSNELLQIITTTWVMTCGHSSSVLIEKYKEIVSKQTKEAKGIRKTVQLT